MEGEEGTAVNSKATMAAPGTPPSAPLPPVASGSGTPTPAKEEGAEGQRQGRQVMDPCHEEWDADDGGVVDPAEGSDGDDDEDQDIPSNDEDDDDGWSTLSEEDDEPMEWKRLRVLQMVLNGMDAADEDSSSGDDASDTSSDEEGVKFEDDDEGEVGDGDGGTISDGGSTSSTSSEPSGGGQGEGELHPMKNPVILQNLFKLCPPRLLANFRLVCKQWLDISLESWRASFPLSFIDYGHGGRVTLHAMDEDVPLKEFFQHVKAPRNQCRLKPFRRYDLSGPFVFPLEEDKKVRIRKLWELVKTDATVLRLYGCSFPKIETFRDVVYNTCSNLKQLELHCTRIGKAPQTYEDFESNNFEGFFGPAVKEPFSDGVYPAQVNLKSLLIKMEDIDRFPLTWLELFSQFPSLNRLTLAVVVKNKSEDPGLRVYDLLPVLEAIQDIRKKDTRKVPLKQLDIHPYFEISHNHEQFCEVFGLLRELGLPLPSIKFNMESRESLELYELAGASEIDVSLLKCLTFHQSECGISTWKFPFQEDPLENLTMLEMTDIIWENMEFLKFTPNLKKLEVIDYSSTYLLDNIIRSVAMISNTQKHKMAEVKLSKMKELTWSYALTEDDLRHLGKWFPNLTSLHTPLNDKLFFIVCEQWRKLESLWVEGAELTDQCVTGLCEGQVVEDLDLDLVQLPPNIRLLQSLESFTYYKSEKLTDVSIFHGFLKLPQLKSLALSQTKGLTKEGKAALQEVGMMGCWRY